MSEPVDRCDCCGAAMKHRRISSDPANGRKTLFACDRCRVEALKALGTTHTAIHIGIRAPE